jgi:hypothetical protein
VHCYPRARHGSRSEEVAAATAVNTVLVGGVLFVLGIALIVWGAERFTDGAIRGATLLAVSPFFVGTVVPHGRSRPGSLARAHGRHHPARGTCSHDRRLIPFMLVVGTSGGVSRIEGGVLLVVAATLLGWLYRRSPVFLSSAHDNDEGPVTPSQSLSRPSG